MRQPFINIPAFTGERTSLPPEAVKLHAPNSAGALDPPAQATRFVSGKVMPVSSTGTQLSTRPEQSVTRLAQATGEDFVQLGVQRVIGCENLLGMDRV